MDARHSKVRAEFEPSRAQEQAAEGLALFYDSVECHKVQGGSFDPGAVAPFGNYLMVRLHAAGVHEGTRYINEDGEMFWSLAYGGMKVAQQSDVR